MAFEPLETDEKLDKPVKRGKDFDDLMIVGCGGFLTTAVGHYVLSVWPFFVWQEGHFMAVLLKNLAFAGIPSALLAIFAARKFGFPGASGAVGGSLCIAIFLYLRLENTFLEALAQRVPTPDYPRVFTGIIPIAWVVLFLLIGMIFVKMESSDLESKR